MSHAEFLAGKNWVCQNEKESFVVLINQFLLISFSAVITNADSIGQHGSDVLVYLFVCLFVCLFIWSITQK